MNNDLISRSEAEKLGATCLAKRNESGQLEAIIGLDNAPTVEPFSKWQIDFICAMFDKLQKEEGYFKRSELEGWLYEICYNNIGGSHIDRAFAEGVEEIIRRLDGFEKYVEDKRREAST